MKLKEDLIDQSIDGSNVCDASYAIHEIIIYVINTHD